MFWNDRPVVTRDVIDHWRLAGHRDGFRDAAHLQVGVDRRGEPRVQYHAFPLHDVEAFEGEGDRISPWSQLDDLVAALMVGLRDPDLLNQSRTAGLNRHTWEHSPRRIPHGAGNTTQRRLSASRRGDCQNPHRE